MLNGTVLDVAVGLIFVFLMLSAACSWVNERIQSLLETRAKMLRTSIYELLGGDDPGSPGSRLTAHPLVRAIAHTSSKMPSYIPSSTFGLALFDTLVPADEHPLTFKRLRDAIMKLPAGSQKALLAVVSSAEGDIAAVRSSVEQWFDNAMDRLSGLYKRHVTVWLFVLGFIIATATNADSILLVQRLEHESALRTAVAAQIADAGGKPLSIEQAELEQMDLLFWDTECLVDAQEAAHHPRAMRQPEWSLGWLSWLGLKILGCLMTALAVSLGGPFWFDALGRLVNLRATGAKPGRAAKPGGAAPG
jgi:hypothetical protein